MFVYNLYIAFVLFRYERVFRDIVLPYYHYSLSLLPHKISYFNKNQKVLCFILIIQF
jgi:hypothetical protein